jgi:HK97 gp10 family phage protein
MTDAVSFHVEGVDEIVKKLKALGDKAENVIRAATQEGAELVKAEIERRAPEDEGDLKSKGFTTKPGSMKDQAANVVVTLADRKYQYAFYQEFGTPNRKRGGTLPARPFMRPAFEATKDQAAEAVEKALKKALGL